LIEELTLRGFKSYRRRQTVRFTQGVNKISGRNASGKTTLLEAVIFGLFGDVPGINKQDLLPLGGGDLSVTVVFHSPYTGQGVRVHREGSPTREGGFRTTKSYMDVEGEDHAYTREREIQSRLRDLLGVGKSTFFNVVYAKQKEFVDILNPDRSRMDAILGLTTPTEIREQLREAKRALEERGGISQKGAVEERIRNAEESIQEAEGQLEEAEGRRGKLSEGLEEKRAELEAARNRVEAVEWLSGEFRRLERQMNELEVLRGRREDRARELEEAYQSLGADPEERRAELQAARRAAEATEERLRRLVDEELTEERRALDGEVARLNHQIGEHLELRDEGLTVCPKCGQEIDYGLLEGDVSRWEKELESKGGRLERLEREMKAVREQVRVAGEKRIEAERAVARFVEQERRIGELKRAIGQLDSQGSRLAAGIERGSKELLSKAEAEMAASFADLGDAQGRVEAQLKEMRDELGRLQGEVRSSEALLEEAERRIREIGARLEGYRETLRGSQGLLDRILEYEAKIRVADSVQEHYGVYERLLRENTLRQLEWLTYKYFERLTDQQAYSGCHIDRERYLLEVQPMGSGRLLPAWRAGGGHESLFALSERLALLRVMGFPHLLILDEPTDAVDSENVPQLLEYIARSGREIGQVLLVTHHGHGEEEGVNLIRVRKVDGESRVYQEPGEG